MEWQEITPFRMQVLMEIATRIMKIMVTGAWHLSFEEMDMVLALVRHGIQESMERNREGEGDVLKNRGNEENHEVQP